MQPGSFFAGWMPGICPQQPGEPGGIFVAAVGLFLQARHLRQQQGRLELGHAQIQPAG